MLGSQRLSPTRRNFLAAALSVTATGIPAAGQPVTNTGKQPRAAVVSEQGDVKTYLLIFDKGNEIVGGVLEFAKRLAGGQFTAIGAVSDAVVGFFDRKKRDYRRIPLMEQAEVVSLTGNIALKDGEPFLHAHTVLGLPDGSAHGGHLFEAHVWPTLEMVLTTWPERVPRKLDMETGLYLLDP
jgi:predicted DNA-binding protein with PD1-like motif